MKQNNHIRTFGSFSFFKNIEYIKNTASGAVIFSNNKAYFIKERSYYIVNYLCIKHLTSLNGYNDAVKNIFNYYRNIPVVLNDNLILIYTNSLKDYHNIFINFSNINEINKVKDGLLITFKSGNNLTVEISLNYYRSQLKRINKIITYLNII